MPTNDIEGAGSTMVDRRAILGGLALAGLGKGLAPAVFARPARERALGITDATLRRELRADYAGTLRRIAAMGYTHFGFRLAPYSDREPPEPSVSEKARMVGDAGLKLGVVRYGFARDIEPQVEEARAIGASVLAYTAAPIFFNASPMGSTTRAQFDAWLPQLGRLAETARAGGLRFAYHNHWWDHAPLGADAPLDVIASTYSPDLVAFEIDLAWAFVGGADPLALVERLGTRVVSMHLKDAVADRTLPPMQRLRPIGEGDMQFARLLPALDVLTRASGFVELDTTLDGLADAERAARTIKAIRVRK